MIQFLIPLFETGCKDKTINNRFRLKKKRKTLKNSAKTAFLRVFAKWYPTDKMTIFLFLVGFVYVLNY